MKTKRILPENMTLANTKSMTAATLLDARDAITKYCETEFNKQGELSIEKAKQIIEDATDVTYDSLIADINGFFGNNKVMQKYGCNYEKFLAEIDNDVECNEDEVFLYANSKFISHVLRGMIDLVKSNCLACFNILNTKRNFTLDLATNIVTEIAKKTCYEVTYIAHRCICEAN